MHVGASRQSRRGCLASRGGAAGTVVLPLCVCRCRSESETSSSLLLVRVCSQTVPDQFAPLSQALLDSRSFVLSEKFAVKKFSLHECMVGLKFQVPWQELRGHIFAAR